MPELDPRLILVERASRQRQEGIDDIEDLKQSIRVNGIINPIVVRRVNGNNILVAGERRLKSALALTLAEVPVRYFDNLTPEEAEIVELEENIKRKELSWRDQVKAVGRIHALYRKQDVGWKIEQTAAAVSLASTQVRKILHVFTSLNAAQISKAEGIEQAFNILHRFAERKAESIVGDIITKGAAAFGILGIKEERAKADFEALTTTSAISVFEETDKVSQEAWDALATLPPPPPTAVPLPLPPPPPVLCANFHEWAKSYTGPKFTLVHCDFPYGNYRGDDSKGAMSVLDTEDFYDNTISIYWSLLETLTTNLDRLMSYSAHLVFWFNMNFYTETVTRLRKTGLMVHDHPLIWHKTPGSGGLGVAPGTEGTHPRRTYDTALLATRGSRPLVRSMCNSYAAPTVGNKIHPSQKPEPMLRYFLQMVVDETTTMLDPTCGSGAALRAAEDLGAKSVLGLELDANYTASANTRTLQARILRQAGTVRKEEQ